MPRALITVQSVADWKTKTRRSRRLPIPMDLLAALRIRQQENPKGYYAIGDGTTPQTNLLQPLKMIAYKAGLNCGFCQSKSGKRCCDGPCCKKFTVQKLRRSYATHLHEGGTSINTLRVLLGHRSPAPLLRYLAPQDIQAPELLANLSSSISTLTGARFENFLTRKRSGFHEGWVHTFMGIRKELEINNANKAGAAGAPPACSSVMACERSAVQGLGLGRQLLDRFLVIQLLALDDDAIQQLIDIRQLTPIRIAGQERFDTIDVYGLIDSYKRTAMRHAPLHS